MPSLKLSFFVIALAVGAYVLLTQKAPKKDKSTAETDREALIELYYETNGDEWFVNDNWLSEKSHCQWHGIYCNKEGRVFRLALSGNGLEGTFPMSVFELRRLEYMWIFDNVFTGELPRTGWKKLKNLKQIQLGENFFTGSMPAEIVQVKDTLEVLMLHNNTFSGTVPKAWGKLLELNLLRFSNNTLTGEIPQTLSNLWKLRTFKAYDNQMSGSVPEWLPRLTKGEVMLSNNKFSGNIPQNSGEWNCRVFDIRFNQMTGSLPSFSNTIFSDNGGSLRVTDNQLTGTIPTDLQATCAPTQEMQYNVGQTKCEFGGNKFSCPVPEWAVKYNQIAKGECV